MITLGRVPHGVWEECCRAEEERAAAQDAKGGVEEAVGEGGDGAASVGTCGRACDSARKWAQTSNGVWHQAERWIDFEPKYDLWKPAGKEARACVVKKGRRQRRRPMSGLSWRSPSRMCLGRRTEACRVLPLVKKAWVSMISFACFRGSR